MAGWGSGSWGASSWGGSGYDTSIDESATGTDVVAATRTVNAEVAGGAWGSGGWGSGSWGGLGESAVDKCTVIDG